MGMKQQIIIKDYFNDGKDLTLDITASIISEKMVGSTKINRLKVFRKSDKHSMRLGMFASIRNTQPGYQSLGFSEVTLIYEKNDNGKFVSRSFIDFTGVAVESLIPRDDEEEITFIAAEKSMEFSISNVVVMP